MVAMGRGATSGVLFRDAEAIERMRTIDTLIVDKTGTLTVGKPAFQSVVAVAGFTEDEVLRVAASLDQGSEHPLADAIVAEARKRALPLSKAADFESATGIGVRGKVDGRAVALGNTMLMIDAGADASSLLQQSEALRSERATVVFLAVGGKLAGLIADADPVKESTLEAIGKLREARIRVVMATGDGRTTAKAVGAKLGIEEVYGEVRPEDKLKLVSRLQAVGRRVAMTGDGTKN